MQLDKSNPNRILVDVENFKIVHGAYYEKSQKHYPIEDYVPTKAPYSTVSYSAFSDSNILVKNIPTGLNQVPSISNRIKLAIIACDHFSRRIKVAENIEEILFLLSMSIPKRGESYNNLLFGFASCSTEYSGKLAISMTKSLTQYLETYEYKKVPPIISTREFFRRITVEKGKKAGTQTADWNITKDDYSGKFIQETWNIIRSNLLDELNRIDGKTVNINSRPSQYFEMICAMSLGLFQTEWRNAAQVQQTMCGALCDSVMKYVALKVPLKCVPKPSKHFFYEFCHHRHQQTRYGKRMLAYAYYARQLIDLQVIKLDKNNSNDTKTLLNSALLDRGMYHGMPLLKMIVIYAKIMKKTPFEFFETFYWEMFENTIDKLASDMSFLQTEYNLNQLMKVYNINWDDQNSMERINTTQLVIAEPFGYYFGRIFDNSTLGQFRADSNPIMYIFLAMSYMHVTGDNELLNAYAVQRFIDLYKSMVISHVLKHSAFVFSENMKTGQTESISHRRLKLKELGLLLELE